MNQRFLGGVAALLLALRPEPALQADDLSLMSVNSYCFPAAQVELAKKLGKLDLHAGVETHPNVRIDRLARLASESNADIVCFQELWGEDNKRRMIMNLKSSFKHCYWNEAISPSPVNPGAIDDGLMIASRRPPYFTKAIVFSDRTGAENDGIRSSAKKGALFMGVCDAEGRPILVITTHMQAGGAWEEVDVRLKQCAQIAATIKSLYHEFPSTQGAQIILVGDVNELVGWRNWAGDAEWPKETNRIVDRTKQLTEVFRLAGIPLSNDWLIKKMAAKYRAEEIVEVFQRDAAAVIRDGRGTFKYTIRVKPGLDRTRAPNGSYAIVESARRAEVGSTATNADMDLVGYANGKDHRWGVIPEGTEPDSLFILDHVFILENRSAIKTWTVDRARFLGDRPNLGVYPQGVHFAGRPLHKDPRTALTDHAAVLVTISGK